MIYWLDKGAAPVCLVGSNASVASASKRQVLIDDIGRHHMHNETFVVPVRLHVTKFFIGSKWTRSAPCQR